jgi:hypothetical protein
LIPITLHPEPRVFKDLWQVPEHKEEGELLHNATDKGVINEARYCHHGTKDSGGKAKERIALDIKRETRSQYKHHLTTRKPYTRLLEGAHYA